MSEAWYEAAFGAHYPLLYQHRDIDEAKRCLDLLNGLVPLPPAGSGRILDLGCGDGRHMDILNGLRYDPVGLDLSSELLGFARDRGHSAFSPCLVRGDMRNLPFRPGSFTAVLSLFTAFGYFGSRSANQDPVAQIARVLASGGHWYLDYFDGDHVRKELGSGEPSLRNRAMGPLMVEEERRFSARESSVCKEVRLSPREGCEEDAKRIGIPTDGLNYREEVAVFTLDQLKQMGAEEGLELVATAGGYEGQHLGQGSRWVLVFRKNTKDLRI